MSGNQDPARLIAERIARRLAGSAPVPEPSSTVINGGAHTSERPRARVINFVSQAPPARTQSSIGSPAQKQSNDLEPSSTFIPQVAQSPWLAPFARAGQASPQPADHPRQARFGVEEAAVSELVEFFENEKLCSVDPSGKPCDHCRMCSSRGF